MKEHTYDIYFTLQAPACFSVNATNKQNARDLAEELLMNMDTEVLIDRLLSALEWGTKIVKVEKLD